MKGLITKGISGFYYVTSGQKTYQCKARGIFKKDGIVPHVGDEVRFALLDEEEGVIDEILPRKNVFIRPPISNVDCLIIVMAAVQPKLNLHILDKFLVTAEQAETDAVICINKVDLVTAGELEEIREIYSPIYPLLTISCETGEGLKALIPHLKGRRSALAGPSGVGKSTLLNKLQSGLDLETGKISQKGKRGKHTTRHVEIFSLDLGGMVYDTPGFTAFDLPACEPEQLAHFYPEMQPYLGGCKFDNCRHLTEPACKIKAAVADGRIAPSRYGSYMEQYAELKAAETY